jgi:hypothetical protein
MNVAEIDPSSGDHVLGRTRDEALQIVDQLVGQNLHGSRTRPGLPERGGSTESTDEVLARAMTRKPEPIEWEETTITAAAVPEEAPVEEEASTLCVAVCHPLQ